jgi:hypothetical protein
LQAKPLQETVDCAQLPMPSQTAAGVSVPAVQLCAAHITVGYEHAELMPSHDP